MTEKTNSTSVLSTQGYRGTRDFFPELQRARHWLFQTMHEVLKSFAYEEYDGPLLEPLELYASKTSEEIVRDQLYQFVDRGERKVAIRPEMTPTLARMVAAKFHEWPRPIRWYSIPTCLRYERPQRGRLREFAQLNVDVFGGNAIDEDVEVILTAVELMKKLGGTTDMFEVRINHRGIINAVFEKLEVDKNGHSDLLRLLDKRDKLSAEVFTTELEKLGLNAKQITSLVTFLNGDVKHAADLLGVQNEHVRSIDTRLQALRALVPGNCVCFKPDVMRGFDYYTGLVFEVFDLHPENRRALFGGGRYENLVGAFGVPSLPGIGYGTSDVSLLNFLESHSLLPQLGRNIHVSVLRFSENDRMAALHLAHELRTRGLNVECNMSDARFGKQIQSAEKAGARAIAFRGEDELKNETFAVKWLKTGEQTHYKLAEIGQFVNVLER